MLDPKPLRVFSTEEVSRCKYSKSLKADDDPLCIAIELGDDNIINLLLLEGHDPSINDNAAICLASYLGKYQLVKRLAEDPRVDITSDKFNALRLAAVEDHEEIVDYFLSINPQTDYHYMLSWAANYGKIKIFKHYLSHNDLQLDPFGSEIIYHVLNSYGNTKCSTADSLFFWGASESNTDMLNLLVKDERFNFDKPLKYKTYPLELVVERNKPEAARIILSTFTEKPHYYDNCLKTAAYYCYSDMVDLLLERSDADLTLAFETVYTYGYANSNLDSGIKYRKMVEKLISDPRFSITANTNSLYHRVRGGYPKITEILLRCPQVRALANENPHEGSEEPDLTEKEVMESLMNLLHK
jgi:ankyrin repeat protein